MMSKRAPIISMLFINKLCKLRNFGNCACVAERINNKKQGYKLALVLLTCRLEHTVARQQLIKPASMVLPTCPAL